MKKILVANRGEIALRVMKTIKKMGIRSVAIFSDADRDAPHVLYADEAVHIGPSPSSGSYLNGEKIIEVCKTLGVDGLHPGYGFLSENADFAEAVVKAGIKFIGPTPKAMRIMGSKLAAKNAVKKYDIPMVPGIDNAVQDISVAKKVASEVGYPILIKASAGGGGKGMRVVKAEEELQEQMERAASEAKSSFGDGAVFIEKYIGSPRHIEVQVLADGHGNIVHLFERECSIQRRHQKVIEEAPSALLTPELRKRMGDAAVLVAKSCNYTSTGTVEFLMDENLNFYFLEMNTRLQVEHPVTEMITGLDLVEQQIRIARGEKLSFTQDDLSINGHAIELRIYAEDPNENFLPVTGVLEKYIVPKGENIRVDDGYRQGMAIPIYYDPMIAKLIVHAPDRNSAIQKMLQATDAYEIEGMPTTLSFGNYVFQNEAFISAKFDTNFIRDHYKAEDLEAFLKEDAKAAAAIALFHYLRQQKKVKPVEHASTSWKRRLAR